MSRERLLSHSSSPSMPRKIRITAISAEGLVDGRKPVNKNAFVAFEIAASFWKRPMVTSVDQVGGNYPIWNDTLEAEISTETKATLMYMYVKVCCRNSSGKDTHVGTARVPVKDFTGEYAPEGFVHCLSYRLWDQYGRRNGVVNFSVRILPDKSSSACVPPFWLR